MPQLLYYCMITAPWGISHTVYISKHHINGLFKAEMIHNQIHSGYEVRKWDRGGSQHLQLTVYSACLLLSCKWEKNIHFSFSFLYTWYKWSNNYFCTPCVRLYSVFFLESHQRCSSKNLMPHWMGLSLNESKVHCVNPLCLLITAKMQTGR